MLERIGLYYPFFHFPSDEWVKLAALYWTRMGRIVPPGYQPTRDSPVVQALGDEFVRNFSPAGALPGLNDNFTEVLTTHEASLRDRYGVKQAHAWKPDPVSLQRMKAADVP